MEDHDVFGSPLDSLAQLMNLGEDDQGLWQPKELGAIFEHQLSAAVECDFGYLGSQATARSDALSSNPPIRSFRDLLHHPRPPLGLLRTTKEFAKMCRSSPECRLPDEVATMLYVLSIVVAITKSGGSITKLDSQGLRHVLDWALDQSWVDEPTRQLLHEGNRAVSSMGSESDV